MIVPVAVVANREVTRQILVRFARFVHPVPQRHDLIRDQDGEADRGVEGVGEDGERGVANIWETFIVL